MTVSPTARPAEMLSVINAAFDRLPEAQRGGSTAGLLSLLQVPVPHRLRAAAAAAASDSLT